MATINKKGSPEIAVSVDRADDGTPQRIILSIDATAGSVLSSTHRSKLFANSGGWQELNVKGIGALRFNVGIMQPIPEADLDETGRANLEASRKARKGDKAEPEEV